MAQNTNNDVDITNTAVTETPAVEAEVVSEQPFTAATAPQPMSIEEAVAATDAQNVKDSPDNTAVSDKIAQPLSLEDALAVAELAESEYVISSDKPVVEDEQDDIVSTATYNPDLVIADLETEAPSIAEKAVANLTPAETDEVYIEDAAEQAEQQTAEIEEKLKEDEIENVSPTEESAVVEYNEESDPAGIPIADISEDAPVVSPVTVEMGVTSITPEKAEKIAEATAKKSEKVAETINEKEKIVIKTSTEKKENIAEVPADNKKNVAEIPAENKEKIAEVTADNKEKAKTSKKKSSAKKPVKAVPTEVAAPAVEAEKPAEIVPAVVETVEEKEPLTEQTATKKSKKNKGNKTKETPVAEDKKPSETTDEEAAESTAKTKKTRKKKNLEPEKNFKLLKALIVVLSALAIAISGHIYYTYILDLASGFGWYKLIPIIPLFVQVLLLLISLITVGTSKRKPIGAAIKANAAEKKAVAAEKEENRINKEIEDTLLVPELDLTPKKTVELSNFALDNFYKKNIEEINGKYYMQVAKFDDSVKVFDSRGATDMELVAVNMVGSAKFDEILDQPRAKTLSSKELASYFLSTPGTFAIKKRGALDWTFKYSSKSFGIIRENDDSYKVSIKCYPDAATKLNVVYKALEDSNFPSGPLWFCFNELRNLPPRVCKWLIDTSCQISKFQQVKTDVLKDDKTLADFDINLAEIAAKFKAGETVINYPKFTVIFSKGDDADLTTYLTREKEGVDASGYTKEFYYKFMSTDDAVSVLCPSKGVSEEIVICLFDNIEKIVK